MSIFFNEQPIVLNVGLAKLIGLNESIVLQQIHYWIEINKKAGKNLRDGMFWTYNTFEEWQEKNFPFWSLITVKRIFKKLEEGGLLITNNFNKKSYDRTKWYTINYDKLESLENTDFINLTLSVDNSVSEDSGNIDKSPESLENSHSINLTLSVDNSVPEDSGNIDKSPESLENSHSINMIRPSYHIDTMDRINMIRPIPETTKEINNREIRSDQVIVKSSQIENQETLNKDIQINKNLEIEELKKEKEILKHKKEIEELKQQINDLKRNQEEKEKKEIKINDLNKYEFYKDTIKKNIDYDWILNNFAFVEKPNKETTSIEDYKLYKNKQDFIKLLDTFLDIMAETMASNKETIKINQEEVGVALVSKKFELLTQEQIFFAIRQYQEYAQRTEVKYPKSYILTCIYNSTTEQIAKDFTIKYF